MTAAVEATKKHVKPCQIADVLTVVTGIMLAKGADFHGVMDVLYPGIMTIGCAAMQSRAAEEIQRQHPKIRELVRVNGDGLEGNAERIDDFMSLARMHFGDTLDIAGPHEVSDDQIATAFRELGR